MLWTGIICAHCSKRWRTQTSCALTSPPSAGIISTPPRTFSKFNLQTHFHLLGQQWVFSLPLATSLALGRLLQTGRLSRFSQVSDYLCFQEIGNSTGETLLKLFPFLPHALTPKKQVSQHFCQRFNCTFSGLDAFQAPSICPACYTD